jgi:hypothetical protein
MFIASIAKLEQTTKAADHGGIVEEVRRQFTEYIETS